ncbi:MAG: ABC transporter permease [Dehalococcoidia bacterium]|nr:ABC transporter permease [Dehalococcoidia bacterium]
MGSESLAEQEGVNLSNAEERRTFVDSLQSTQLREVKNDLALAAYKNDIRERLGVDKNYIEQWWSWITNAVQGDLGTTITGNRSVADEIGKRLPVSLQLGAIAMVFGALVAIPTGIMSAVKQDKWPDYILRSVAIAMLALPSFFIATMVIGLSSRWWSYSFPTTYKDFWESPTGNLEIVVIPAIILGFQLSGTLMRLTRAQMLEVMRQDYIRTARAKGLGARTVVMGHAVRNALLPVITILGLQVPVLIGGSLVLETIFAIPGVAQYLFTSIGSREFPSIIAVNMVIALVIVVVNLVIDVAYGFLDPRVQLS